MQNSMCLLNRLPDQLPGERVPVPQARREPGLRHERAVSGAERGRHPGDTASSVGEDADRVSRAVRKSRNFPP